MSYISPLRVSTSGVEPRLCLVSAGDSIQECWSWRRPRKPFSEAPPRLNLPSTSLNVKLRAVSPYQESMPLLPAHPKIHLGQAWAGAGTSTGAGQGCSEELRWSSAEQTQGTVPGSQALQSPQLGLQLEQLHSVPGLHTLSRKKCKRCQG